MAHHGKSPVCGGAKGQAHAPRSRLLLRKATRRVLVKNTSAIAGSSSRTPIYMNRNAAIELVDIVDDSNHTIAVMTRAEMRAQHLPHRCTYILVFNQSGELFIHLRTSIKDVYPSYWDVAIGGVLAAGESYDEGARREVAEELGIEPAPLQRLFPFRYSDARTTVHGMVYRMIHNGPFRLQAEEIVSGEFCPLDVVRNRINRVSFCPDGVAVLHELLKT
jgi:isopentenyldiphosphate isomerase